MKVTIIEEKHQKLYWFETWKCLWGQSLVQIWPKIGFKYKIIILNTPKESIELVNTYFEDIWLLATLAVINFPMCSTATTYT